jgi:hypothetical protein
MDRKQILRAELRANIKKLEVQGEQVYIIEKSRRYPS